MQANGSPTLWEGLPGGVSVAVTRMHGSDPVHGYTLSEALKHEAQGYGESFNVENFHNVLHAIETDRIQAYFIMVAMENCQPQVAGVAIQFPTVITRWNSGSNKFEHFPAVYGEDVFVFQEISEEIRKRTTGPEFPNGVGIGTYFNQFRIKLAATRAGKDRREWPNGVVARGRVAEYAPNISPKMESIYKKLNTYRDKDHTILVFPNSDFLKNKSSYTINRRSKGYVTIESLCIRDGGSYTPQPHIFATTWSGNDQQPKMVATYTEGISTYTGETVARVQLTSNNGLPDGEILRQALTSMLAAGQAEILRRKWMEKGIEIPPLMRIHALHEDHIEKTMKEMGAESRLLGSNPMHPTVTDFSVVPFDALGFRCLPASPFIAVKKPVVRIDRDRRPQHLRARQIVPAGPDSVLAIGSG